MMPSDQIQSEGTMDEEAENVSKTCHIYLICRRPSTYFIKDTMKHDGETLEVDVGYKIDGKEEKFSYKGEFPLLDGAVTLAVSDYPHREITTYDQEGKKVRGLPASVISVNQGWESPLKQLEVLYIGQAFGNGTRSAHERLKSHSTLQKILADSYHKYPDSEISVLMVKFEPYQLLITMDGSSNVKNDNNVENNRFRSILENSLSEKQQIGIVEAALIRYFQPFYNDKFKIKFPSPKVKVLKKCYELDFSGLVVEINTQELMFLLYSKERGLRDHHICNVDISDEKSRAGFFYVNLGSGNMVKISDCIEPSSYRKS
ncbi:hypothetical protein [Endozoicomonas elysicola]|nr:hypothetical protein [Endozoicomonas elysicola]